MPFEFSLKLLSIRPYSHKEGKKMPYQKFAEKLRRDIEKLGYEVNKTKWDIDGERFEYLIVNTGKGKVSLNIQRYWQEAFEKGYQMMFASVAKIAQGKV